MTFTARLHKLYVDPLNPDAVYLGLLDRSEMKVCPRERHGWKRRRRCSPVPRMRARLQLLTDHEQLTVGRELGVPWVTSE